MRPAAAGLNQQGNTVAQQWTVQYVQSTGAHELEGPTQAELIFSNNVNNLQSYCISNNTLNQLNHWRILFYGISYFVDL